MKLPADATLLESGVDWITVTARDRENRRIMRQACEEILHEAVCAGDDVNSFRWKGFEGVCVNGVDLGERFDCTLVRLHGETARYRWWDVAQEAQNCSRLDFQQTWSIKSLPVEKVLNRAWRAVQKTKVYGKPVNWHYRRDINLGNTLEIGRRTSDAFGRMYNKEVESQLDHYRGCARMELELKRDLAWSNLLRISSGESVHDWVNRSVCTFFSDRGVSPGTVWDRSDLLTHRQPAPDLDRYLMWLSKSVRVGVRRAVAARGLDAVMHALGLDDPTLVQLCDRRNGPGTLKGGNHDGNLGSETDGVSLGPSARERVALRECGGRSDRRGGLGPGN